MPRSLNLIACLLLGAIAMVTGAAQTTNPNPEPPPATRAELLDRLFLHRAEAECVAAKLMAKLAIKRSKDQAVIALAQSSLDNHTQMSSDRAKLFTSHGIAANVGVRREHYETYKKLSALSDAEFDRAYIEFVLAEDREENEAILYKAVLGKGDVRDQARIDVKKTAAHLATAESIAKARGIVVAEPHHHLIVPSPVHGNGTKL